MKEQIKQMDLTDQVNILDLEGFFDLVEMEAATLNLIATSELISEPMDRNAFMLAANTLYDGVEKYRSIFNTLTQKKAQTTDNE